VVYPTNENGGPPRERGYPEETDERGYRHTGRQAYSGNGEYYQRDAVARYSSGNDHDPGDSRVWGYSENGNYQDSAEPRHSNRSESYPGNAGGWDYPNNGGYQGRGHSGNREYYPGGAQDGNYPGNRGSEETTVERYSLGSNDYLGRTAQQRPVGNGSYPGSTQQPGFSDFPARPADGGERGSARDRGYREYQPNATARTPAVAVPRPPVAAGPGGLRAWREMLRQEWVLVACCSFVAFFALMYNLFGAPDVLYDEAAYTNMAQQVALHGQLSLGNQPMFIHPPLMWLIEGAWLRLTGYASATEPSSLYAGRVLAAFVGALAVLLVAAMAYRLAGNASPRQRRVITGAVTLVAALDPVLVRYDRQDVIEPFALFMGMLVLHAAWSLRARGTFAYVSVVGLLSGLALLTNEIAVFLVIIPVIYAILERSRPLIRQALLAFGVSLLLAITAFLWAIELHLTSDFTYVQTSGLLRLIGLIQSTGFNVPGVSLVGSLEESLKQYSSSYIMLATGFVALVWCYTRKNNEAAKFLAAWLTSSYALAVYIAAIGTLNVNFFCYPLPGCIVGSVFLADAVTTRWINRRARRRSGNRSDSQPAGVRRLPIVVGAIASTALVGISGASWVSNYSRPGNGVAQADQYIATKLPACAMVNASGDPAKYAYLLDGRDFGYFSVGPNALADGIHYFLLAPTDAIEFSADMSPQTESWIEDNGQRLATFPSATYRTVQLWYVPASSYDPAADLTDISGGVYVNTVSSDCGGYTVTDGKTGDFYSAYTNLGGKGAVGKPVSRVTGSVSNGYQQAFDGIVLERKPGSGAGVQALPVVATLARQSPAAYRAAGLPAVLSSVTSSTARSLLTNPALTRFYLGGNDASAARYAAAVQRYGQPLGPPVKLSGGGYAQAFADVVLEVSANGESVHAATIAPTLLKAGVLRLSSQATAPQPPAPLPNGQYGSDGSLAGETPTFENSNVLPFVVTLVAILFVYGVVTAVIARRRRQRRRAIARNNAWLDRYGGRNGRG
jgi:hypothetical protein